MIKIHLKIGIIHLDVSRVPVEVDKKTEEENEKLTVSVNDFVFKKYQRRCVGTNTTNPDTGPSLKTSTFSLPFSRYNLYCIPNSDRYNKNEIP